MKIEHLLVQHLYQSKKVTLQGIGTLKLNPAVILPAPNDKDFTMPENAFEFEYNLKAVEDEALINYIVLHTNKILPLASADLDSYIMLAKQFLNIGKPLVIEGVGTIQKNQAGAYQFVPGHFITPRIDDIPKQPREKRDESVSFESEARTNNSSRNLMIGLVLLIVVLGGLGIYYWLANRDTTPTIQEPVASKETPLTDTAKTDTSKKDTVAKTAIDTFAIRPVPSIKTDSNTFKIVLKDYPNADAVNKAYKRLSTYGHKLVIMRPDSFTYQLAMPFKTALSDTSRAKDSLRTFFGGKPYVKL